MKFEYYNLQHCKITVASFQRTFRATTPPHNFFAATFLIFVKSLFEVKRKKLRCSESLRFAVELLANSAVVCIVILCFQKQPPEVFYKKRCSYKFHKIHRKSPVPESL